MVELPGTSKPLTVIEVPLVLILLEAFQVETPALARGAAIMSNIKDIASLLLELFIVLCILGRLST
jgi:hypothetical protein